MGGSRSDEPIELVNPPLQWPPGKVGRYRNTDPVLANYLIRLAVEKRGENYWEFPQRALFDKLGIRTMVLETDSYGNYLLQVMSWHRRETGHAWDICTSKMECGTANEFLPEGFVRFVSTVSPAWAADGRLIYGGFFWINGDGDLPVPKDAYYMNGAGGQWTLIVPTHQLVVVRQGHYRGRELSEKGLKRALSLLMEAVPQSN